MLTSDKIIKYLTVKKRASAHEMVSYLDISRQAVTKQLAKLIISNQIGKIGKPPKVFYFIKNHYQLIAETGKFVFNNIEEKNKQIINQHFLVITPAGEKKDGWSGFVYWCEKNSLPVIKTSEEYLATIKKYDAFKKDGLIDGLNKMKNSFDQVFCDAIFYLDFYSIERFGKTRLGQLLLYAKQSQNRELMKEIIKIIKPQVDQLIAKYDIDGIGFVPPTVKRETQLMKVLEQGLHEQIRKISITKLKTEISIPQKTLSKLSDRIENANNTIIVEETAKFKNILLIDDAVGSGATLNETAKKIREKNICSGKIISLAITGSFKGFDVISEV